MQGITENDLLDLTPELKAEALEVVKRYRMGPLFTPPVVSSLDGPLATLAGARRRRRRELAGRFVRSGDQSPLHPLAHSRLPERPGAGELRSSPTWATSADRRARRRGPGGGRRRRRSSPAARRRRRQRAGPAAGQAAVRPDHRLRHEHGRHAVAEDALLDAGRDQEPSRAARPRTCRASASLAAPSSAR